MKFPKKIRIGCKDYNVKVEENHYAKTGDLGMINFHLNTIVVNKPKEGAYAQINALETLCHEYAHGYFNYFNSDMNNEKNCDMFADMMVNFMRECRLIDEL